MAEPLNEAALTAVETRADAWREWQHSGTRLTALEAHYAEDAPQLVAECRRLQALLHGATPVRIQAKRAVIDSLEVASQTADGAN
jgi:hypothetical protein